jgi:hypothetical protein
MATLPPDEDEEATPAFCSHQQQHARRHHAHPNPPLAQDVLDYMAKDPGIDGFKEEEGDVEIVDFNIFGPADTLWRRVQELSEVGLGSMEDPTACCTCRRHSVLVT